MTGPLRWLVLLVLASLAACGAPSTTPAGVGATPAVPLLPTKGSDGALREGVSQLNPPTPSLTISVLSPPTMTPTETPLPSSLGLFNCSGHESGLLATAGSLIILPDGTVQFQGYDGPKHVGTWSYGITQNEFVFSAEIPLDKGTYNPKTQMLLATVRTGVQLTHAELGLISCELPQPKRLGLYSGATAEAASE